MGEMAILGKEGDTKVIWDIENRDEVKAARDQFDTLTDKGFLAYRVGKDQEASGGSLRSFPKNAGKIIMIPPIQGG